MARISSDAKSPKVLIVSYSSVCFVLNLRDIACIIESMKRLLLGLFILIVCTSSVASSVVRLTLPDIADHSGQILIGAVVSLESYWTEEHGPRTIETQITLEQVSYLKGRRNRSSQFVFTMPGGTVGDMTMRIAGAPEFKENETWVLFLLPEWKSFPTVGLYQGAYQLVDGEVRDGNGVQVSNIDNDGFVISALGTAELKGRARGDRPHTHAALPKITHHAFLERVSAIANDSKKIQVNHDSGKRIKADYTSVPLKAKQ